MMNWCKLSYLKEYIWKRKKEKLIIHCQHVLNDETANGLCTCFFVPDVDKQGEGEGGPGETETEIRERDREEKWEKKIG